MPSSGSEFFNTRQALLAQPTYPSLKVLASVLASPLVFVSSDFFRFTR